ncbi:hypothetical protein [Rhodococcus aetherivorans]|uniref:hypothetical protein n=1 Tax=Rhodococcus aetherivorans TaxID=191292 RepID=UPI002949A5A4|nr:hypothetical protein [Rhodococcus aetherivorans]MDV6295173.1 hypothetical protein [Rhodococcus aetherivorans]
MAYKQLRAPNLNVTTASGWCLKYVQDAFGSGWAGTSAWEAWTSRLAYKHADRNIPAGVYVPIWFDGYDQGQRYGHAAIYKDGRVYSSPYTKVSTHAVLNSIADVERIYGMTYVGWSEDIGGTKVIELGGDDMTTPEIIDLAFQAGFNRQATPDDIKTFEGKTVKELLQHVLKYNLPQRTQYSEFNNVAEALKRSDAEVERLRAELASKTTPAAAAVELKPGLYEVK